MRREFELAPPNHVYVGHSDVNLTQGPRRIRIDIRDWGQTSLQ